MQVNPQIFFQDEKGVELKSTSKPQRDKAADLALDNVLSNRSGLGGPGIEELHIATVRMT